jgi:hypothetical protein
MEMQSVPVHKAFHEGRSVGNRWQMPPMQKYRVRTYAMRLVRAPQWLYLSVPLEPPDQQALASCGRSDVIQNLCALMLSEALEEAISLPLRSLLAISSKGE